MMDGFLQLLVQWVLEHLSLQNATGLYALVASICLYFQWQRIKLLKDQNLFSETKRSSAQEDLRRAMEFYASNNEGIPFPHRMSHEGFDILLIDDEEAILSHRALIEEYLPGSRVRIARNAAEAWGEIEHKTPSLIITDIIMPVLDGYALLEKLAIYFPSVPVIAISAYVNSRDELMTRLGDTMLRLTFLAKPFTLRKLIAAIKATSPRRKRFAHWLRRILSRGRMLKSHKGYAVKSVTRRQASRSKGLA